MEFGGNPTAKDLAVFTRQFSVMIDSGVPLVQCLQILAETQENKKFQEAINGVLKDVESGNNLAASMKTNGKVFDELYCNMVAAGEAGGILDTIFQRLSVYIEKAVKLQSAVKFAMVYPISVVLIAGGVITLILWKVVPAFTELFNSMNVDLPLPTRIVIGASCFVGNYGLFIIIGLSPQRIEISRRWPRRMSSARTSSTGSVYFPSNYPRFGTDPMTFRFLPSVSFCA